MIIASAAARARTNARASIACFVLEQERDAHVRQRGNVGAVIERPQVMLERLGEEFRFHQRVRERHVRARIVFVARERLPRERQFIAAASEFVAALRNSLGGR